MIVKVEPERSSRAALPLRVVGKWAMGSYPYEDLYMLPAARQFVPAVRNTKLVLLGGITNRDHLETGMREGFDFFAMGRALLREALLHDRVDLLGQRWQPRDLAGV